VFITITMEKLRLLLSRGKRIEGGFDRQYYVCLAVVCVCLAVVCMCLAVVCVCLAVVCVCLAVVCVCLAVVCVCLAVVCVCLAVVCVCLQRAPRRICVPDMQCWKSKHRSIEPDINADADIEMDRLLELNMT